MKYLDQTIVSSQFNELLGSIEGYQGLISVDITPKSHGFQSARPDFIATWLAHQKSHLNH
jgi:hypothetical protein